MEWLPVFLGVQGRGEKEFCSPTFCFISPTLSQPLRWVHHPVPWMGSFGSMCLTPPQMQGGPTCSRIPSLSGLSCFQHFHPSLISISSETFTFYLVVLFTSLFMRVKSALINLEKKEKEKKEEVRLCCLALSFSHFLRHIFTSPHRGRFRGLFST